MKEKSDVKLKQPMFPLPQHFIKFTYYYKDVDMPVFINPMNVVSISPRVADFMDIKDLEQCQTSIELTTGITIRVKERLGDVLQALDNYFVETDL